MNVLGIVGQTAHCLTSFFFVSNETKGDVLIKPVQFITKVLTVIGLLAFAEAGTTNNDCDGIILRGKYHEKEVLADNLDRPYLLIVDFHKNVLYFSYSASPEDDKFISCYLDLNTKELGNITQVDNGFAQAVDQDRHEVYIGGSDGIFKFFYNNKTVERAGAEGVNIWSMFYKDQLYYTSFPQQFIYTLKNGEAAEVEYMKGHKADFFVIDKDDYTLFKNESGLYGKAKGSEDEDVYDEDIIVRALITDLNGLPYVCGVNGVYFLNKDDKILEKIGDLDECFGLAFDKDNNMIYSDPIQVVRLKLRAGNECS
ncbi:Ommochrome-binding protein [Eumeta japonica]|uniref:Ommochrome-binding protein n=1 Tax=Eumeta variegata TaxID=151549 RepID=A0A4C1X904_EUMVA|nr:Ommochrome-binding protein [Eumeta japonica]